MLYVVTRRLFLSSRVSSLVINLLTIFELTLINNDKGRNSIAALVQSVPPVAPPQAFLGEIVFLPSPQISVEQAFVGREEIRSPLKTPAGEAMPPVDWTSLQRSAARGNIPR